jgi:type II secretion system protein N
MTLLSWIKKIFNWLWQSKLRLGLMLACLVIFVFLLFPYDDLSDLVSGQVATATKNSVFLQFDKLRLSLFPQPGLKMNKVFIETLSMPGLSVEELTLTPSISAFISQQPHGRLAAKGLLKGQVEVKVGDGGKSERGTELTSLQLQAQKLSLQELKQIVKLPMMIKGQLDLETNGKLDLLFQEQPNVQLNMKIQKFEMPAGNFSTEMGDIPMPEIKLSDIELKGKVSDGRLLIESGKFGGPNEDLNGTIKGSIQLSLRNYGTGVVPEFGSYSFDIDFLPSAALREKAGLYLSFLSSYTQGSRYRMKISGSSFGAPPQMSPLR